MENTTTTRSAAELRIETEVAQMFADRDGKVYTMYIFPSSGAIVSFPGDHPAMEHVRAGGAVALCRVEPVRAA